MQLYLIRHARAGDRQSHPHDRYRRLTEQGHREAELLASVLAARSITSILTSPATRCVQTVEPLAVATGLPVQECQELWETSSRDEALARIGAEVEHLAGHGRQRGDGGPGIVACSHGNLIPEILEMLADSGVRISGRGCERGSIWLVRSDIAGTWTEARYFSPRKGFDDL